MSYINFENSTITTSVFGDLVNDFNLDCDNVTLNLYPINYSTSLLLAFLGLQSPAISSLDDQRIILNFDGTQGSTDFIEEVKNLSPHMQMNCQIDTNWKVFGSGSLGISNPEASFGGLSYQITPVTSFTMQYFFNIETEPLYATTASGLNGTGFGTIFFGVYGSEFPVFENVIGYEGQELPVAIFGYSLEDDPSSLNYHFISEIDLDTQYHVCIEITPQKRAMIFLNGIKVFDQVIPILLGPFVYTNVSIEPGSNIDAFEVTTEILHYDNFTTPTSPSIPHLIDTGGYTMTTNSSLLILSETQSENLADELNIYGSCSVGGIYDSTATISFGDVNILNIDGETKQYYFFNGLNQYSNIISINGDFTQDINDNKLFLDTLALYKSSGIVLVDSTYIKHCSADGDAEFNANVLRGNIDGGGNTGWTFTYRNQFIPKIVMIF